jgi:hypothetical protein
MTRIVCQYRRVPATQELVLRQNHAPGERRLIDYVAQTIRIESKFAVCALAVDVANLLCRGGYPVR